MEKSFSFINLESKIFFFFCVGTLEMQSKKGDLVAQLKIEFSKAEKKA